MGIGERISERMSAVGINQANLASAAGINPVTMMRIRKGESTNIRATTAIRLAKALKCNIDWLIMGKGPMEPGTTTEIISSAALIKPDPENDSGFTTGATIGAPADIEGLLAMIVSDDMLDLPKDSLVYIDPTAEYKSGDYVLVRDEEGALLVRKYRAMGAVKMLEATADHIPEQFKFVEINDSMKIIGKAVSYNSPL